MSEQTIRRKPYTSDLTDAQWDLLTPFVSINTGRGTKNTHPLREILNAIFYINVNSCKWADLPRDFPPPTSVSYHYGKWTRNGTWRRINDALRDSPELVNSDPYGQGWMIEITPNDRGELDELLTHEAYTKLVAES